MNDEVKKEVLEMEKNPDIKTIDENYDNLKAVITALTNDYEKFKQKKVKAAGQRVRASLLNTKKLCDTLRKQVKEEITAIPIKHRNKSSDEDKSSEDDKPEEKKEEHPFVKSFREHVIIEPDGEEEKKEKPKRKRKANKPKVINKEN